MLAGNSKRQHDYKINLTDDEASALTNVCKWRDTSPSAQLHRFVKTRLKGFCTRFFQKYPMSLFEKRNPKLVQLTVSNAVYSAIQHIGMVKNKEVEELMLEILEDYVFGIEDRITKAEALSDKAMSEHESLFNTFSDED